MQESHPGAATSFLVSLIAGGLAGTSVDVALYPIDTIKTRIQSPQGFLQAGGFRGVYNGLSAAAIGSAPGAALFFTVYEQAKDIVQSFQTRYQFLENNRVVTHMIAASWGEAAACLIRVPTEAVKQNMQAQHILPQEKTSLTMIQTLRQILAQEGGTFLGGLYRGYNITLMREIPFALIQFPLYEHFKVRLAEIQQIPLVSPFHAAFCGSVSGGIAAAITTPLDVLKTRLMLGKDKHGIPYTGAINVAQRILQEEGSKVFWSGIEPRVLWISIGGFVFFGAYEQFRWLLLL
jgi:solute carrier family 25 S-adenosylmethionine transporter 26